MGRAKRDSIVFSHLDVGIAYKTGSPQPDIRDADSFKAAMLAAKSIVYVKQGASGLYFISVCERLGIAEQVKAKAKILPGGRVAELNAPLMKAKGMEPG